MYLVVDDDDPFRTRLIRALADRQLPAVGACSISEALGALQTHPVTRAIVDLRIGADSGLGLIELAAARFPEVAYVVLTGFGTISTATNAIRLGARHYLTKPVTTDEILAAFEASPAPAPPSVTPSLAQVEWEHIHRVLEGCGGNISVAAKQLGLHRRSLQRKLQNIPAKLR